MATTRVFEDKDEEIKALKAHIRQLQADLDKELEWKDDKSSGTRMSQEDYNKLAECYDTATLTDYDAKAWIAKEFGFALEKITIINEADSYEVNRHGMMRTKETYKRNPIYNATDWNYIRFDCADWSYEMINGQLYQYYC